jgi:predicted  nucleic acid-binding Zn-ribbon protein
MVVTTASKLMLAEDEIDDLNTKLDAMEVERANLVIRHANEVKELKDRIIDLESEVSELRYDLEHPWWKFW